MKYFLNEKVITNEYGSLRVFGVTGPTTKVEDVSEDKKTVEALIEFLNRINFDEEKLQDFIIDFVDIQSAVY